VATAVALVSGTAGLATLTSLSTSAQADPSFVSSFAGVGADVTQDLFAGLTGASPSPGNGYTTGSFDNTVFYPPLQSSNATGDATISSFDASPAGGTTVNPGCITTKLSGPSFDRPNSSTAGINALYDSVTGTGWENSSASCTGTTVNVTGQIDFARSARGPKTSGTTLTFIPYGRDAVGILYYDKGDGHLASLTTAELTALYSSSTGTEVINGDTVAACLTISGSTPRSNLEAALGLTDAQASAAATAAGCNNIQQNSGNSFYTAATGLASGDDAVIPISSGSWISQINGLALDRSSTAVTNGVDLAAIDSLGQPYTLSGSTEVVNTTYYQSTSYGYNLYTVLPTAKLSGFGGNAALESLFVGGSSALCSTSGQAMVNKFGFDSLTAGEGTCGSTTTTGNG
jgi:hypothetical protein